METKVNNGGEFWKGFFVGGILGGLAGLFFAPKSGKELRAELARRGCEIGEKAGEFSSEAQAKVGAILDDARRRAEGLKKEADRQIMEARQKAGEALKMAEEKAFEIRKLARQTIEDAKEEAKRLKAAVDAGVEAAKCEFSKEGEKPKTTA